MNEAITSQVAVRESGVTVDGATLHVREDGDPRNPCVILLGSLAADARLWREQIPALAGSHYIVRYDYRGHGKSFAKINAQPMRTLLSDLGADLP